AAGDLVKGVDDLTVMTAQQTDSVCIAERLGHVPLHSAGIATVIVDVGKVHAHAAGLQLMTPSLAGGGLGTAYDLARCTNAADGVVEVEHARICDGMLAAVRQERRDP